MKQVPGSKSDQETIRAVADDAGILSFASGSPGRNRYSVLATLLFSLLTPLALTAQPGGTILSYSYSTYLGGSQNDQLSAVALDAAGNAYVAGTTASANLPTVNALYPTYLGGTGDIMVAKYSPAGKLIYCTYMGGSLSDSANGIAVDAAGNAYVVGQTASPDFPSVNPIPAQAGASAADPQAFILKLDPTGQKLLYSTLLGPGLARNVAVDTAGNAYIGGDALAANFPIVGGVQQTFGGGGQDGFVLKLAASGAQIVYSTFLGGGDGTPCAASPWIQAAMLMSRGSPCPPISR